jgi:hypothetical protein
MSGFAAREPQDEPKRLFLVGKAVLVGMAVIALGLPLNRPVEILILIAVIFVVACGEVRDGWRSWLGAIVLLAALQAAATVLPDPRIEEGQNVFVVDEPGGALSRALPADAYAIMAREFDEAYPPAQRCALTVDGCWRRYPPPTEAFAATADGLLQHPLYSRRVRGIDFDDAAIRSGCCSTGTPPERPMACAPRFRSI